MDRLRQDVQEAFQSLVRPRVTTAVLRTEAFDRAGMAALLNTFAILGLLLVALGV